jgi:hypothetical protein
MQIPRSIPYFKLAAGAVGLYAVVWLALEGSLPRDVVLAAVGWALGMAAFIVRRWGGWSQSGRRGVLAASAAGLVYGLGVGLLTLGLMAFKTGLHDHGPEYAPSEIAWVLGQLPVWGAAGALVGLGVGLLGARRQM